MSSSSTTDPESAWRTIEPPPFPSVPQYTSCYCEENIFLLIQQLSAQLLLVNKAAVEVSHQQKLKPAIPETSRPFVPVWDLHAVFISNVDKTVLLYDQRASKAPEAGSPVIWDYHVIAVATCQLVPPSQLVLDPTGEPRFHAPPKHVGMTQSWVYDFDSNLSHRSPHQGPECLPWTDYNNGTFRPNAIRQGLIPIQFEPMFRSVAANDLLALFASDRSHMLHSGSLFEDDVWHSPPPVWDMIVGDEARRQGTTNNLMERYVDVTFRGVGTERGRYGTVWDASSWLSAEHVPRGKVLGGSIGARPSEHDRGENGAEHVSSSDRLPLTEGEQTEGNTGDRMSSCLLPAYLHAS